MWSLLLALLVGQSAVPVPPPSPVPDVRQLTISTPRVVAEIDTARAGGDPIGIAWSKDGTIYLRVVQDKGRVRHYQIVTTPELSIGQSDGVPEWAATYWNWKSAASAPDDPAFKLNIEQGKRSAASVNAGGELAGVGSTAALAASGDVGGGTSEASAIIAASSRSTVAYVSVKWKDQVVGEWIDQQPQLGLKLAWAPAPMAVLAYVTSDGKLGLIDRAGHVMAVAGTRDAVLPAWSIDGQRISYLQKKSPKLYVLMVADVRR